MIVRVGMAPRMHDLTPAQCARHWRTEHADAARQLPGLRGYVQDHAVLRDGRPLLPYPGFDVCAETAFDVVEQTLGYQVMKLFAHHLVVALAQSESEI